VLHYLAFSLVLAPIHHAVFNIVYGKLKISQLNTRKKILGHALVSKRVVGKPISTKHFAKL
jgi:hypothetical protein